MRSSISIKVVRQGERDVRVLPELFEERSSFGDVHVVKDLFVLRRPDADQVVHATRYNQGTIVVDILQ